MRTLKSILLGVVIALAGVIIAAFVMLGMMRVDYHLANPAPVASFSVTGEKMLNVLSYSDDYKKNIVIDKIYYVK